MTVVGRTGHMNEAGEYVPDTVTIRVEDGEWACVASGSDEADARERGQAAIDQAKEELRKQQEQRRHQRGEG